MAHKANSLAHTKWLCKYHIVASIDDLHKELDITNESDELNND